MFIAGQFFLTPITDVMTLRSLLYAIRKSLSTTLTDSQPSEKAVSMGFLRLFADLLKNINDEDVIIEVGWCLTNIAALKIDSVKEMRELGIHYQLVELFNSGSNKQKEQLLWALGNILCGGIAVRDELLNTNLLKYLKQFLNIKIISLSFVKITAWVLSGLTRGKPFPSPLKV